MEKVFYELNRNCSCGNSTGVLYTMNRVCCHKCGAYVGKVDEVLKTKPPVHFATKQQLDAVTGCYWRAAVGLWDDFPDDLKVGDTFMTYMFGGDNQTVLACSGESLEVIGVRPSSEGDKELLRTKLEHWQFRRKIKELESKYNETCLLLNKEKQRADSLEKACENNFISRLKRKINEFSL